ncbi:LOW QUALITY PROTEIN: probable disease resistance protein At1g61190 [Brassica rapa]|uniref:LOW QUALITY PROTEIN: probable disease resistance protein At1g61190 n=1 Tax=Brassica campestris TaxID=3711 RepID=UPI0004F1C5E9|nr:LOW QUALITY PROTEIN: probable disease resistance protein At1g61190 [Brassica rapa]
MGNCMSFQPSCDATLDRIISVLCSKGYIGNLKKNLRDLQRETEDLRAIHDVVKNKVAREKVKHRHMLKPVQVWLTRVESFNTRVDDTLSTSPAQLQKLCLCGLCSKNVYLSYNYGRRVFLLLEEVKKLKSEGNFQELTELTMICEVVERPTRTTVGQEEMLETAWERLMEEDVGIMGLHGMGGVGKTTLFKQIHNKFATMSGKFDVVIWIVVSQGASISKLQEDIAQKLRLCDDQWTRKDESDKAAEMHRVLKGTRFVLMLDDIWEKVDLEAIGVPEPTRENGCKVAFTTRSKEVCGRMGDHEPMQVKCLERDQAWELFRIKVGESTLSRDPNIVELARKVAEKCHGLPLALSVIGETMSYKTTVEEWEHANYVLTRSAAEFSDMENKILPILKYSYDNLADEHIKSCFLYCALFPEDYEIVKESLIECWICEGFVGEYQVLKRAVNKGYELLCTLIRANLLTEFGTIKVGMHDVIREMALWIASDLGKQKESFVVQAGVGLHDVPKVKDWGAVRRMSLIGNHIKDITQPISMCSQLTTLLLQKNGLDYLSGEFIQSMQKLVVLDLSRNDIIGGLPEQISELTSLQYLDVSYTNIRQLPASFRGLKKLTHLNLTGTERLGSIRGISKLSSLTSLKLLNSKVHGDVNLVKELQHLEHLQVLTISISTDAGLEELLGDQRLAKCIDSLSIRRLNITLDVQLRPIYLSLLMSMENLRHINVTNIDVSEIDTNENWRKSKRNSSGLHNPTVPYFFTNLSTVGIVDLNGMTDLTWLLFAPNLVKLHVGNSEEVKEIINKKKAKKVTGISPPFQKLEMILLELEGLPKLESIYWTPLPFPFLKKIVKLECPKLRKLPLNATSVSRVDELSIVMKPEEEAQLEWEDEDTKNRFSPLISLGREM